MPEMASQSSGMIHSARRCAALLVLLPLMAALSPAFAQAVGATSILSLQATFGPRGKPIREQMVWRVYRAEVGDPALVARSFEASPNLALPPGDYVVHAAHGLAGVTRRVSLGPRNTVEQIPINVGGLTVSGQLGGPDRPLTRDRQTISVYVPTRNNSEGRLVTNRLLPGEVLRLPEGSYHVVSVYRGSNSTVRADIRVQTGKVVEAVMTHRAATMTMKLVRAPGGVALANTSWAVQTPGGDVIREAIGAFPTMELAEGVYEVIARHDGKVYRGEMPVHSGADRDFEVVVND